MTAWQEGRAPEEVPVGNVRRRRFVSIGVMILIAWGGLAAIYSTDTTPKLGLDLAGGTSVILRAPAGTSGEQLDQAVNVMRKRIEALGNVQEPVIQVAGSNNIVVQLPGVTDRERALEAIGSTGQLSFRAVTNDGAFGEVGEPIDPSDDDPSRPAVLGNLDPLEGPLAVDGAFALGADISNADALFTGFEWVVSLDFTSEGDDKFAEATRIAAGYPLGDPRRRFAIVLDGTVISAPQVAADVDPNTGISGGAQITLGGAEDPEQEARDLEIVLKFGALPIVLERDQVQFVSATLGRDSLDAGLIAGFGGLALVGIALVFYYRVLGLVAMLGLSIFGSLVVVAYSLLGASQGLTLTLAGVAGIIVSVGITSDSYIVYFERIKEEIRMGRTVKDAVEEGFGRAFRTILTADTVSFMGAILLWFLAIGPVKGFALALGLATLIDVFVAYFYTRNAVALAAATRLGEGGPFSILGTTGRKLEEAAA